MARIPRSRNKSRIGQKFSPRLFVERLEDRTLLAAAPFLPQTYLLQHPAGLLSSPSSGEPLEIALDYLNQHAGDLGLTPADLRDPVVTNQYTDQDTGITHIYLGQSVNSLEVAYAKIGIHITGDGGVLAVAGGFVPGLNAKIAAAWPSKPTAVISAAEAVRSAGGNLGFSPLTDVLVHPQTADIQQTHVIAAPGLSQDAIPARLHYVPSEDGGAVLAWQLIVRTHDGEHWYDLSIDASTGAMVAQSDWVGHAAYTVLPIPTENPDDGPFQSVVDPHLSATSASPFGWHDTNGIAGAESTLTIGNNVDAHLDRDGDNVADAGGRPDGGAGLTFNFAFNPALQPLQNANAAVTNLFYWNNICHDVFYQYGFNSAAGNFQTNTYGLGGLGSDAVQADAQDGADIGSLNNANFTTPPDGLAPRMQMFEFNITDPRRDSDFDAQIIVHEYGHGVSNRLTGGPANANALVALQSGGMGEGWSDWFSLMFGQTSATDTTVGHGIGMYALGQTATGLGFRDYRYQFDIGNQDLETFLNFGVGGNKSVQVHDVGTRWASTLWDLTHLLIQKHGYEPNLFTGGSAAGNIKAMHLVMNGLKLQPANPSFIHSRDAILAADTALNGSANHFEIWTAFARRGLGFGASTSGASSSALVTSFDLPPSFESLQVTSTIPAVGSTVAAGPTNFTVNFSANYLPSSVQANDFSVNSTPATGFALTDADTITFTFSTSPVVVEGLQTMAIAADTILKASDSSNNLAFNGTFRYDITPLAVISTIPSSSGGEFTLPGPLTYDVTFNEAIDPGSIGTDDLSLSIGTVTNAVALDADTARYTLGGITNEGTLDITLGAGKVLDAFGNQNPSEFSASYSVDAGIIDLPTPLVAIPPLGALVYESIASGSISPTTDADVFAFTPDANQQITVVVHPTTAGWLPTVTLTDPGSTVLATGTALAGNQDVVLQGIPMTTLGVYTVEVEASGGGTGDYTLRVILNAAVELENHSGSSNNTAGSAQALDASFVSLPGAGQRAAALGAVATPEDQDFFSLNLAVGDTMTVALKSLAGTSLDFQLYDAGSILLTGAVPGPSNFEKVLSNFHAQNAGTYFLVVTGDSGAAYDLVVTKNAEFDVEANDSLVQAQEVLSRQAVDEQIALGHAGGTSQSQILEFDEVPFQPVNGLSIQGVTFGFTVGGLPSTGANYNSGGPGELQFTQDPSMEGNAAGILTLEFDTPTSTLEFGVALSTFGTVNPGFVVQLFDSTLSLISTTGVVTQDEGFFISEGLFSHSGVGVKRAVVDFDEASALRFIFDNLVFEGVVNDTDYYKVNLGAGAVLDLLTFTPAGATGEFVNLFDPLVSVYRADGTLAASDDNSSADGINAQLTFTNTEAAAAFFVAVSSTTAGVTSGEYVLSIKGNTVTPPPFQVASTIPADGASLTAAPSTYTLDFNDNFLSPTVEVSDLQIDGLNATGVTQIDGNSLSFTLPGGFGQGTHTVTMAGGAITDVQGTALAAFSATFVVDTIAPRVTASSVASNSVITPGPLTYQVTFNEAMNASNLSEDDFTLQGNLRGVFYSPSGFSFNPAGTVLTLNYGDLPDDNYTLTLLSGSGSFTDAAGNTLDGEFTGTFPSGNGTAGGNFVLSFNADVASEAVGAPLTPETPLGSLINSRLLTRVVAFTGDSDSFTITVDAGQTITVLVTPAAPLRPAVELRDPSNALVTSGTAAVNGQIVLLNPVAPTASGTYKVSVSGASSTVGLYTIQVTLNAALELESNGGSSNDTIATAQDIGSSSVSLGATANRLAVMGASGTPLTIGSENFESGVLPPSITTFASNSFGRIRVIAPGGTGNPSAFALLMDTNTNGGTVLNEAIYTVNLSGLTQAFLSFSHINFSDDADNLPLDFTGHVNGDGVAISANGTNWRTILNAPAATDWATMSIDLGAAAAAVGMTLGPNFKIKFQQFDNFSFPTDGRAFDNIQVSGPDRDTFKFTLAAGERATLGLGAISGGNFNIELRSSADVVLATGSSTALNLAKVINNFTAPAADTYYARVTGDPSATYSLLVVRNAGFDFEANGDFGSAQNLDGQAAVLGHVSQNASLFDVRGTPITGSLILSGSKVTLGINEDGSFITAANGTGIKFLNNEFVVPGAPLAGFTIAGDGLTFTNEGALGFTEIAVTKENISSGQLRGVRIVGMVGSQLRLERIIAFHDNDEFATIATRLTNLSSNTIVNVAALENLDPDQEQPFGGDFSTFNDVVLGGQLVRADAKPFAFPNGLTIGLGSADSRAVVSAEGFEVIDPFEIIDSPVDPDGVLNDIAINLAFDFGDLAALQSVSAIMVLAFGATTAAAETTFSANTAGTPVQDEDWYTFNGSDGGVLELASSTPADGAGEPGNPLNPRLELYSPTNVLVASGTVLGDGRNESIHYTVPTGAGGLYRVRVFSEGGNGTYLLTKNSNPVHFAIEADANATAGSLVTINVTALDPGNNTASGYQGILHFTSTDAFADLPTNATLTNGIGSFHATLKTAGNHFISATDTVISITTGTSNAIAVAAAGAAEFVVSMPPSAAAGSAHVVAVVARDPFGNTAAGYDGSVHFTSSDAQAVLPADSPLSAGLGHFVYIFLTQGSQTISATDTAVSSITGTSNPVAVSVGPVHHFTISGPDNVSAGATFNLTVTAQDQFNNTATAYTGTVHFSSTDGIADLPPNAALTSGVGTFSAILKTAGVQTISAADTVTSSISGNKSVSVAPSNASQFAVGYPSSTVAGNPTVFSVVALDQFNNTATSYSGLVNFTSTDGQALLPGLSTLASGVGHFVVTFKTAGNRTITATDSASASITGTGSNINVGVAALHHFAITAPANAITGNPFNFTIAAQDAFGNLVPTYAGTASFGSNDATASLPPPSTLTGGMGTFSATLKSPGNKTITASDAPSGNIVGASNVITSRGLVVNNFAVTPTGFTAQFNKAFDPAVINLYEAFGAFGVADVSLVNNAAPTVLIRGSLLLSPTNTSFTFIRSGTGTSGVLAAGVYTATIRSASNGFKDALGGLLDGNNDGTPGDSFISIFTVASTPSVVLSIPDFARGPDSGNSIKVPNNTGTGMPVILSGASGVVDVTFDLIYNPALLQISGTLNGPSGSTFGLVSNSGGVASFHFNIGSASPLGATATLGQIVAVVPNSAAAIYKTKQQLTLSNITAAGAASSPVGNNAVHIVAYFADASGDGSLSGGDASLILRTSANIDTGAPGSGLLGGFGAYRLLDPPIIGDLNTGGSGTVDGTDVTLINSMLSGTPRPQVPSIPTGLTMTPMGPDPTISVPGILAAAPGENVVVPVNIDMPRPGDSLGLTEAVLALRFDPRVFTVSAAGIQLGSLFDNEAGLQKSGWQLRSAINNQAGEIGIDLFGQSPLLSRQGGSLVFVTMHVRQNAIAGPSVLNIVPQVSPEGRLAFRTHVADPVAPYILFPAITDGYDAGVDGRVMLGGLITEVRNQSSKVQESGVRSPESEIRSQGAGAAVAGQRDYLPAATLEKVFADIDQAPLLFADKGLGENEVGFDQLDPEGKFAVARDLAFSLAADSSMQNDQTGEQKSPWPIKSARRQRKSLFGPLSMDDESANPDAEQLDAQTCDS